MSLLNFNCQAHLVYKYSSIHGCTYKARPNKGERQNTRTEKMDCPFAMKFKATLDGHTEGILLGEESVECLPEKLPSALLDENLDINIIRKYFDSDGWTAVTREHETRKQQSWTCQVCTGILVDSSPSIGCDSCLNWSHWKCVGLTKKPRKKFWFCKECD